MIKRVLPVFLTVLLVLPLYALQPDGNPFKELNYQANIATFSDYEEFHDQSSIVQIGSVWFDIKSKKVVGFIQERDTLVELLPHVTSTSIDPHCEKYYSISPYVYCFNNPVRFIDPDGKDVWEINKDGYVEWKEESENHVLYALDKKGKRTDKSLAVSDRGILDQLTQDRSFDGNYAINSSSEMAEVFIFAANNTDVEWGIAGLNNGDFMLTTSHKETSVNINKALTINGFNENDMVFKVHSHPGADAPRGASVSSAQRDDMDNIKEMANRFYAAGNYTDAKFPKHFIYHPASSNLYQYTPYTQSLNLGVTNGKTFLSRVKKSKSTFYPY